MTTDKKTEILTLARTLMLLSHFCYVTNMAFDKGKVVHIVARSIFAPF